MTNATLRRLSLAAALAAALTVAGCGSEPDEKEPVDDDDQQQVPVWAPSAAVSSTGDVELDEADLSDTMSLVASSATGGSFITYRLRFAFAGAGGALKFGANVSKWILDETAPAAPLEFKASGSGELISEVEWTHDDVVWVLPETISEEDPSRITLTELEWKSEGLVVGTYLFELQKKDAVGEPDDIEKVTLTGAFELKITEGP